MPSCDFPLFRVVFRGSDLRLIVNLLESPYPYPFIPLTVIWLIIYFTQSINCIMLDNGKAIVNSEWVRSYHSKTFPLGTEEIHKKIFIQNSWCPVRIQTWYLLNASEICYCCPFLFPYFNSAIGNKCFQSQSNCILIAEKLHLLIQIGTSDLVTDSVQILLNGTLSAPQVLCCIRLNGVNLKSILGRIWWKRSWPI